MSSHARARIRSANKGRKEILGIKRKKNGSPPSSRSLYSCHTHSAATACRYTATPAFESLDAAGHEVPKTSLLRARRAALSIERKAATLRQRTYPAAATPRFAIDISSSRPRRRRDSPETYPRRSGGNAAICQKHIQPRRRCIHMHVEAAAAPRFAVTYPAAAAPRFAGDVYASRPRRRRDSPGTFPTAADPRFAGDISSRGGAAIRWRRICARLRRRRDSP